MATDGDLKNCSVRSVIWRLFLNVIPWGFPCSEWRQVLGEKRVEYEKLRQEHMIDPTRVLFLSTPFIYLVFWLFKGFFHNKKKTNK